MTLSHGLWCITIRRAERHHPAFAWTFGPTSKGAKWLACNVGPVVVGVSWPGRAR